VSARLDHPFFAIAVSVAFAAVIAAAIHSAWDPPLRTYLDHVPIGAVFAVLVWDRLVSLSRLTRAELGLDAVAVTLAGLRAVAPPLPFVSGHALLTLYALVVPSAPPLKIVAALVLAHVVYEKVFASGGWLSMVAGFSVALLLGGVRYRRRSGDGVRDVHHDH
jgi:hypothetical protein